MRETLNVPEDGQFMSIAEHDSANFRGGNAFGITRSDDLVYVEITVSDTRTLIQKGAVPTDCRAARRKSRHPGEDVFVNRVSV
jgi:hypothetical protein